MTSKVTYLGNLRTEAIHIRSGNTIITDAPVDNNGKGEAFSPTDLVATALGSCMTTIMGIAAEAHKIDIEGLTVEIHKFMASNPRRIEKVQLLMTLPAKGYSKKERKILEAAAHGCPVGLTIKEGVEELTIQWKDDEV